MNDYRFRILNVFAREDVFSGNPLAVFEDGTNLDETTMQSLQPPEWPRQLLDVDDAKAAQGKALFKELC